MPPLEYPSSRALAAGADQHHAFHHLSHGDGGLRLEDAHGSRHGLDVRSPRFNTRRGLTSNPPLAITDAACASCSVVTLTSWPMDTEASDVLAPALKPAHFTGRFAGQRQSGLLPEAEAPHVIVHIDAGPP